MNKLFYLFVAVSLLISPCYAELNKDGKPVLRATFIVDSDNLIGLEITGDTEHMIEFNRFGRSINNPNWKEDEFQMKNFLLTKEDINKNGSFVIGVGGSPVYNKSGLRLQKAIDKWDGEFIITNPLPTTRKDK